LGTLHSRKDQDYFGIFLECTTNLQTRYFVSQGCDVAVRDGSGFGPEELLRVSAIKYYLFFFFVFFFFLRLVCFLMVVYCSC
jgi:hypothetical protein